MQERLHAQSPGSGYTQKVAVLIRKMIIHKSKQRNKKKKLSHRLWLRCYDYNALRPSYGF